MDSQGRVKATNGQWSFSAVYVGNKVAPWGNTHNSNNHRVSVYNRDTGKRCYFDFWASEMQPEIRSRREVYEAVGCFVSDAWSGEQTFDEFCGEYGYDDDSRQAERVWKACVGAHKKLLRVAGSMEAMEELRELLEDYR